jgi:hypothetical protein
VADVRLVRAIRFSHDPLLVRSASRTIHFQRVNFRTIRFSYSAPDVRLVRAGQGDGKVSDVGRAFRVAETGKVDDCLFVLIRVRDPMTA